MTPKQVWFGMWVKILSIFWPAVLLIIVGLIHLWKEERTTKKTKRSKNSK